ncbi:MAG TPA: hypothetical protein VF472_14245 [Burkholderiaceae bacterium]
MRYSTLFALAAVVLFGVSLVLPSVDVVILGKAEPVPGFTIVYIALGFGISAIGAIASGAGAPAHSGDYFLAAFAAIFNVLFLAMPVLLFRRMLPKRGLDISGLLLLTGMGAGVATPFAFGKEVRGLEAGFYVWLLAYVLLLAALVTARRELKAAPAMPP